MNSSKQIRLLTLAALIIATPVYPMGSFLSSCKASIANIFNRKASEKDVGIGLAVAGVASLAAYGLVKYLVYKRNYQSDAEYLKSNGIPDRRPIDVWYLCNAVATNDQELIRILLKHGVDIDDVYGSIGSPLEIAIKRGNAEIVELLLSHNKKNGQAVLLGALRFAIDEGRKNDAVYTSLEPLLQRTSEHVFYLALNNAVGGFSKLTADVPGNPKVLDLLIQHGKKTGKIKEKDLNEMLINLAPYNLTKERSEIINIVLKHGADINAYSNGCNPLKTAVQIPEPKMARFLLEHGAEIVIPDTDINVYRYVDKNFPQMWKPVTVVLDNHRRKLAMRYGDSVGTHLTKDPTGIVVQYLDPCAKERPLKSLELVDDGLGADPDEE